MKYIVDREEAKKIDVHSIEEIGIPSLVLMERAALAVAEEIVKRENQNENILIVCGNGNNGADGIALGRIMFQRGYQVVCYLLGEYESCTEDNRKQQDIAKKIGLKIVHNANLEEYTIIVDAIFGIGLNRSVDGRYKQIIQMINHSNHRVYAVDIPSGIHATDGHVMSCAIKANFTVTFGYQKLGMLLYPGTIYAGKVIVADIGFDLNYASNFKKHMYDWKDVLRMFPKRTANSHKGNYGKLCVIAGTVNMAGACFFSAMAAYQMGVGLVKIVTPEDNRQILQQLLPEAVLCSYPVDNDWKNDTRIIQEIDSASAIVVGPGLGQSEDAKYLLSYVVEHSKVPTVIDADGLRLLAKMNVLQVKDKKICWNLPEYFVLTPHVKEMLDLLGNQMQVEELKAWYPILSERLQAVNPVLVLKDSRTFVVQKEQYYMNRSGNHGMATGGSGDVLSGMIGGLLCLGMQPYQASCLGTYLHGLAGDAIRKNKGASSVMTRDLIEGIHLVLKQLDQPTDS